jgi:hypothetical protein
MIAVCIKFCLAMKRNATQISYECLSIRPDTEEWITRDERILSVRLSIVHSVLTSSVDLTALENDSEHDNIRLQCRKSDAKVICRYLWTPPLLIGVENGMKLK